MDPFYIQSLDHSNKAKGHKHPRFISVSSKIDCTIHKTPFGSSFFQSLLLVPFSPAPYHSLWCKLPGNGISPGMQRLSSDGDIFHPALPKTSGGVGEVFVKETLPPAKEFQSWTPWLRPFRPHCFLCPTGLLYSSLLVPSPFLAALPAH